MDKHNTLAINSSVLNSNRRFSFISTSIFSNTKSFAIITFLSFLIVLWLLVFEYYLSELTKHKLLTEQRLNNFTLQLDQSINQSSSLTESYKAVAELENGLSSNKFQYLTSQIGLHPFINSMSVTEGYILKDVYPREPNKKAIGLDFTKIQSDTFNAANTHKQVILTPPTKLVQGGLGLILRNPLFINGQYWGQIASVLDVNTIFLALKKNLNEQTLVMKYNPKKQFNDLDMSWSYLAFDSLTQELLQQNLSFIKTLHYTFGDIEVIYTNRFSLNHFLLLGLLSTFLSLTISYLTYSLISTSYRVQKDRVIKFQLKQEKDKLLLSMLHDIRQPINALHLMLTSIDETDASKIKTLQPTILRTITNINQQFESLTEFEKISIGKLFLSLKAIHLPIFFERYCQQQQLALAKLNINIDYSIISSLNYPCGLLDEIYFTRILNNIVDNAKNAIQAHDTSETGRIHLELSQYDNDMLRLKIIDNGVGFGMPSDQIDQLTNAFQNHRKSVNHKGELGLGLYITKKLCEKMGVELELSKLAYGAQVELIIPCTHQQQSV